MSQVAFGAISHDATNATIDTSVSSGATYAHTCSAGTKLLVVGLIIADSTDADRVTVTATYNGDAMTEGTTQNNDSQNYTIYIFYLVNPDTGSPFNIALSWSGGTFADVDISSTSYEADGMQVDSTATPVTTTSTNIDITWNTTATNTVAHGVSCVNNGVSTDITLDAGTSIILEDIGILTALSMRDTYSSSGSKNNLLD